MQICIVNDENKSLLQVDFVKSFHFLWIVDCETARNDWILKISGVTKRPTPWVSPGRPKAFAKKRRSCGHLIVGENDIYF